MDLHAENGTLIPQTIRTARLVLRAIMPDDDTAIVEALADWEVVRWLTAVPWPYTAEDAVHFRSTIAHGPDSPHWAIDDGTGLIGVISVKPDLGYWLSPSHHRKGYMTEAATAVVAAAFDAGASELVSGHIPGNAPSRSVLTRLGFRDTHRAIRHHAPTGTDVSVQRMILTRADWHRLRNAAR